MKQDKKVGMTGKAHAPEPARTDSVRQEDDEMHRHILKLFFSSGISRAHEVIERVQPKQTKETREDDQ